MLRFSKKKKTETVCVRVIDETHWQHIQTETKLIKYLPRTAIREIDRQKKIFYVEKKKKNS
jgi:hypothetical protein